jgi:hypothetical protein
VPAFRTFSLTVITPISRNDRRYSSERTDSLTCLQRQGFFEHAIKFRALMAGLPVMQKFGIVSSGDAIGCTHTVRRKAPPMLPPPAVQHKSLSQIQAET